MESHRQKQPEVTDLSMWTDESGVDVGATSPGRLVGLDVR